ncbi:hypothetical protein [Leptospira bandrabouensis]|uniref:Uncharacterized protein n=1 Tax=Leptospira bandrabouensis TaxID=2484903 RepID=A0A6H3P0T1_9LEPT|nr:hypothetical protein [Leptospira bandrabouensis]MCG6153370.1 hypothetical protein [Leptospira bandrabouensis]MCW7459592.1 hypothetical protein [Leptospira bandrabouensis]MCW7478389.1 hypothetical protein [Leptospira bandrabouensis]MCW7486328.1 hypothetical protein [Leptospira bandrabouensis]TGN06047.1 hypothetical protein EHR07_16100 [Leptospira bandrabouensis]
MKTSNQTNLHCDRLYQRSIQFLRWNLPVLTWTVISLSVLKCEGTSPDPKTILVPLLVAAEPNTSANLGGNQSGSGTETPIGVGEIPASPPLLNEVTYITNPANPADDPYSTKGLLQFQKTSVSFQKPVPANTEINFYFGKNNMALNPDGTVTNAIETLKRTTSNFSGFTYLCDSDKKYKVFVVAKNEFGIATKELRIGHARKCADAPKTPAFFGDCNDHCIEATKEGDTIELTAKFNLPVQGSSLNLDIIGYSPRSLPETIAPFADLEIPIPNAGFHTIKTSFNIQNKELLCARVESTLIMGQPFQFTITNGYISIPNE